jgi:hypothetical protein
MTTHTTIFEGKAQGLNLIPGPLRVETFGDVIWAAGGHANAAILRYADGRWTSTRVRQLLNFILPLSERSAIVGGASGALGRTDDGGQTWSWQSLGGGWLVCISRDAAGRIWIGQQDRRVWRSVDGKPYERVDGDFMGQVNAVKPTSEQDGLLLTDHTLYRLELASGRTKAIVKNLKAKYIDVAADDRGRILLLADKGQAWLAQDGATFEAIDVGAGKTNLDAAFWLDGKLVVLAYDGFVRTSEDGVRWTAQEIAKDLARVGGVASWRGGWLVGTERRDRQGGLHFLGEPGAAPVHVVREDAGAPDPDFAPPTVTAEERERLHAELAARPRERPTDPIAQLEQADGEARELFSVHADALVTAGDPRGELASLQLRLASGDRSVADAELELRKRFFGKLEPVRDLLELEWSGGYLHSARVRNEYDRDPEASIDEIAGWLLDEPSGRFLRKLVVGIVTFEDNGYGGVARAIGATPRPALRTLWLGDFGSEETELNWSSLEDLSPIWPAVPNLRELWLRSGSMTLGSMDLPRLERLEIVTGGLDDESARRIAAARWPELRELIIQVGRPDYGGTAALGDVLPILEGRTAPRLEKLGLTNLEFTDELVEPLARSRLLPQLRALDLSMGTLSDDGARAMRRFARAFAHLEQIQLDECYVGDDESRRLVAALPSVRIGTQRDDDGGERYAAHVE